MSKDRRYTAGRYGSKDRRLTRDDFAAIVFTLLPADESESSARDSSVADTARSMPSVQSAPSVPRDVIASARRHCKILARAWSQEPIAILADLVADLLAERSVPKPGVLYAAALLCDEEAARIGETSPEASDSARSVSIRLKSAVLDADRTSDAADAARSVESAFDD